MRARVRVGVVIVCSGLLLAASSAAPARAGAARMKAVAEVLLQNEQELGRYIWTSRTEISVDGEPVQVTRVRATHGKDGALIEVPLPDDPESPQRSRKKLKKKALAFYEALQELTRSYVELDPVRMQAALARSHAWEGQGERGDLLRIQARGVIRQADRLDLWVDGLTHHPRRLEVLTSLEGEPVRLTTEFERLENGLSYAARTVVETELKEKKMVVRTRNSDFVAAGD